MLGTQEDAEIAAALGYVYWNAEECDDTTFPKNWEFIGEGVTRVAFLSPTGIVYKVDNPVEHENIHEYEMYLYVKDKPSLACMVAECHLWSTEFGDVIAMEYIPNECDECTYCNEDCRGCADDREIKKLEDMFAGMLSDFHSENVRKRATGEYVIIDYSR